MAKNLVSRLPRSLQNNKYAVKLAEKADRQGSQISELKQTAGRPGRGKRLMCNSAGAVITGGLAGMVEAPTARAGIGIVGGGVLCAAGAALDSDALFDGGVGALAGGLFAASAEGSSMLKTKVIGDDDDFEEDDEDDE